MMEGVWKERGREERKKDRGRGKNLYPSFPGRKRKIKTFTGNLVTQVKVIRWLQSTEHTNSIFST